MLRLSLEIQVDCLGLGEGLERVDAVLSSVARVFVAAERHVHLKISPCPLDSRCHLGIVVRVEVDGAGFELVGDSNGSGHVLGEDAGGQAVGRVVRPVDDLLLRVEGQDQAAGPEDLLPHGLRVILNNS